MTTNKDMHYKTAKANDAAQKELRKTLRNNMTPAEALLWRSLRASRAGGWKWRRQQGIGPFVLDFYCPALRLCIELDGSAHDYTYEYDNQRTDYLNAQDIRVVRFTNDQVFNSSDGVVAEIIRICSERQGDVLALASGKAESRPHPQPLPLKGGEKPEETP
jgi:very-short-patch-repair endonuclease